MARNKQAIRQGNEINKPSAEELYIAARGIGILGLALSKTKDLKTHPVTVACCSMIETNYDLASHVARQNKSSPFETLCQKWIKAISAVKPAIEQLASEQPKLKLAYNKADTAGTIRDLATHLNTLCARERSGTTRPSANPVKLRTTSYKDEPSFFPHARRTRKKQAPTDSYADFRIK